MPESRFVRVPLIVKSPPGPDVESYGLTGLVDVSLRPIALTQVFTQRQVGVPAVVGGVPIIETDFGTSVTFGAGVQVHIALPLERVAELFGVEVGEDITDERDVASPFEDADKNNGGGLQILGTPGTPVGA